MTGECFEWRAPRTSIGALMTADFADDDLWHAIIERALQPGAKLPEDAIGEK